MDTGDVRGILLSLEAALQSPRIRASRQDLEALLAKDFIEIGSSGRIYDRAGVIDALVGEREAATSLGPQIVDFTVSRLSSDTVLVTYRGVSGEEGKQRHSMRSSIWRLAGGTWTLRFHQGTPISG